MLESVNELLGWDERALMPIKAGGYRAEQLTMLSGMVHRRATDPQVGQWLEELVDSPLAADPHSDAGATIRQLKREYEQRTRLPRALVEELTRAAVLGQQAWSTARKNNDFAAFAPHLEHTFALKREQADALGYSERRYDALLDLFEPEAKTSHVERVLADLREALIPLVEGCRESARRPQVEILQRHFPIDAQREFAVSAARAIGFDFHRGRLDVTEHPFCAGLGPHDCRITTRYDERFFSSAFFGVLHEAGHGIYDQGLRAEQYGLPPGSYVSLGIHESQSRMWENAVGRSMGFWRHFYSGAQAAFPQALGETKLDDFHFAINDVRPSLIRVEADEITYNLHIIIRFELEQALLDEKLSVADLPAAWNAKYQEYLGIEPPSDADGVLQDIHWSAGLIGYFPTYSLGNLCAAQFFETAEEELGDLSSLFVQGEFTPLREWLGRHIHQAGQCYTPSELVENVTGRPLEHASLIASLRKKLAPLYCFAPVGR